MFLHHRIVQSHVEAERAGESDDWVRITAEARQLSREWRQLLVELRRHQAASRAKEEPQSHAASVIHRIRPAESA